MRRNQIPHSNWFTVFVILAFPYHIRIMLSNEPYQFGWVYTGYSIVRVKLYSCHLAQVVNALAVLTATECHIISIRWFKRFQSLNCSI